MSDNPSARERVMGRTHFERIPINEQTDDPIVKATEHTPTVENTDIDIAESASTDTRYGS